MKHIFYGIAAFFLLNQLSAQDTTYYNNQHEKVQQASQADYYVLLSMVPSKPGQVVKRSFFTDHRIRSEEFYKFQDEDRKAVIQQGTAKQWFPNGNVRSEEEYVDGKLTGEFVTYWENSHKKRVDQYDNGVWKEGSCFDQTGTKVTYYAYAETPSFPGGKQKMFEYLAKNMRYPSGSSRRGAGGKVITSFLVNEDGTLSDLKIEDGAAKDLNEEALRVIRNMPPWTPARQDGEIIAERFNLPLSFVVE